MPIERKGLAPLSDSGELLSASSRPEPVEGSRAAAVPVPLLGRGQAPRRRVPVPSREQRRP